MELQSYRACQVVAPNRLGFHFSPGTGDLAKCRSAGAKRDIAIFLMLPNDPSVLLSVGAAVACFALGVASLLQHRRSFAGWCFIAGMAVFGMERLLVARSIYGLDSTGSAHWWGVVFVAKSIIPAIWLPFSLTYSRGNYLEFLRSWRPGLAIFAVLPPLIAIAFVRTLIVPVTVPDSSEVVGLATGWAAKGLTILLLIGTLLILMNFERTLRATVGSLRWRVKFLLLGVGLIFATGIYTKSQLLIFSRINFTLIDLESVAILVGCGIVAVGHLRRGMAEIDVYPSRAFLQNSVTFVLVGCYLLVIGVLAQIARWIGGSTTFQIQAFVVLIGVAGLGILLLSERLRQRIKYFVSRHLRRPHHDFRGIWRDLTERLASAGDPEAACAAAARTISETLNALSVTIWQMDDRQRWILSGSTVEPDRLPPATATAAVGFAVLSNLRRQVAPFHLEQKGAEWAESLREITRPRFSDTKQLAVPLRAGEEVLGIAVLADRVYGRAYTVEEKELLQCLAGQLAATLLNFRLGGKLATAREMETFQTMSAFFVHDLKNSASNLNLMLQNLPRHFDNPEFREDALRALASSVGRINKLIARLSSIRNEYTPTLRLADLDALVAEVLEQMGPRPVEVVEELGLGRSIPLDSKQFRSVMMNLLTNAHEATPPGGEISVRTEETDGHAVLTVRDNGCGMTKAFLEKSLFHPFQTTKKKGIGIGMFQTRMIVEAHRGQILAVSEPGKGTTFHVLLPLENKEMLNEGKKKTVR